MTVCFVCFNNLISHLTSWGRNNCYIVLYLYINRLHISMVIITVNNNHIFYVTLCFTPYPFSFNYIPLYLNNNYC